MKNKQRNTRLDLTASSVELEAAAEGDAPQLRRFTMTAYTGGAMQLAWWRYPVVVDLEGLDAGRQKRPILLDHTHDVDFVMGQTDTIVAMNGQLIVTGQVMGESDKARQVIALNDKGFAWQASIGARADKVDFVPEGKTVKVNGREFTGPINVARKASLGEISFVVLGADDNTSAQIAASQTDQPDQPEQPDPPVQEQKKMAFQEWLTAQGFEADSLSEPQTKSMQAMFDREQKPETPPEDTPTPAQALRAEAAAEATRIGAIHNLCAGKNSDIEAKAIGEGWDVTRTELELLRAARPAGPAIHSAARNMSGSAIEAAMCLRARIDEEKVQSWYGDKAMEAATSEDLRGIGINELMHRTIQAAGMYSRPGRVSDDTIRTAFEADRTLRASGGGFSTISLSGILSNVANKALLESYGSVASVATRFCALADVNDFKQVTRYRLTGTGMFEKVGPDGELKHTQLSEESYTNQIDTYGRIIALTRQMMINDDLGSFLQIPRILGRQSALAVESAVFTLLLSNPGNFFGAGNKNYASGANTALQVLSLSTAEQLFADQVDSNGKPILITPAILLVPTSLKVAAQQLMTETRVNETTTADKPKPANNPHVGKWEPLASPYLNSTSMVGYSTTAWYLFANPSDVAAMEIAFLRGQRTPVIESGETDFDTLGMKWRGYFDFGVAMQDYRAAVKLAGA